MGHAKIIAPQISKLFIPHQQKVRQGIRLVGQHLETNDLPGRIVHGHLIQLPIASHDHILPHHQRLGRIFRVCRSVHALRQHVKRAVKIPHIHAGARQHPLFPQKLQFHFQLIPGHVRIPACPSSRSIFYVFHPRLQQKKKFLHGLLFLHPFRAGHRYHFRFLHSLLIQQAPFLDPGDKRRQAGAHDECERQDQSQLHIPDFAHLHTVASFFPGIVTRTIVPSPGTLENSIFPLCSSTISWQMDSPRPAPPFSRERDLSTI